MFTANQKLQVAMSAKQTLKFQPQAPLVVNWDGKLLHDLIGREHVDQLPLLESRKGIAKLLTVTKLASGSGESQGGGAQSMLH